MHSFRQESDIGWDESKGITCKFPRIVSKGHFGEFVMFIRWITTAVFAASGACLQAQANSVKDASLGATMMAIVRFLE